MIERLQIYKDTYLLTTKLYASIPHMEKMHKHMIGVKMLDTSMELFTHITLANKTKDRGERLVCLDNFFTEFEKLRVLIRICGDMKLLKLSILTDMYLMIENISKQISNWKNATSRMPTDKSSTA